MKNKEPRPSEASAHVVTVTGWACKHCNRWWGDDECMARYCCATDFPCECGGRREKPYTHCKDCRDRRAAERWAAKDAVEWDGTWPLAVWDDDAFFFDEDDLECYLDSRWGGELDDALQLTTCRPDNGRHFEMNEYLQDSLPDDSTVDADDIDKTVNDWIALNAPFGWQATGDRVCLDSVRKRLGLATRLEADND